MEMNKFQAYNELLISKFNLDRKELDKMLKKFLRDYYKNQTVIELKEMAKKRGLSGYSNLRKSDLVKMLKKDDRMQQNNVVVEEEIIEEIVEKEEIIEEVVETEKIYYYEEDYLNRLTVAELKEAAKKRGFSGYSNLRKEELIDLVRGY